MTADFKKLLGARFFFTFGVQMQAIILGWRVYEIFQDPLALGLVGLSEAVPAIGLALYAGYLVDRARPLLVYRQVIGVSLLSGLLVLAEHVVHADLELWSQASLLYGGAFLTGLARSFAGPAIFASVPRMVPAHQLLQATALMSSFMQVARIAGPAIGGLMFGFLGPVVASTAVCLLLFLSLGCMAWISVDLPVLHTEEKWHTSGREEFFSGLHFVRNHPILLPALSLDMISVLFGGVTALLPVFAHEILQVGPRGLGLLRAAPAVGATVMSLYLAHRTLRGRSGTWLLSAVAGFGMSILVFGLSQNFWLSCFALVMSGVFDSVSMVIRSAAVQMFSPDHMRGKISAVNSIFIGSSNELGELESGIAAKVLGTVPAVLLGGVVCLITVSVMAYASPKLRQLDLSNLRGST